MEVKRNKAEPVTPPPDTIDITGLTLREAGALRYLVCNGLSWYSQEPDIKAFFMGLASALSRADIDDVLLTLLDD